MTIALTHCYRCGRSFAALDVDRSPYDEDACTDCATITRHSPHPISDPDPETRPDETL